MGGCSIDLVGGSSIDLPRRDTQHFRGHLIDLLNGWGGKEGAALARMWSRGWIWRAWRGRRQDLRGPGSW